MPVIYLRNILNGNKDYLYDKTITEKNYRDFEPVNCDGSGFKPLLPVGGCYSFGEGYDENLQTYEKIIELLVYRCMEDECHAIELNNKNINIHKIEPNGRHLDIGLTIIDCPNLGSLY
jgi:predicted RNase H-like HicB family nuclease